MIRAGSSHPTVIDAMPTRKLRFAVDSPVEGGGFELPVPDERGYGLAFVCRVMGLLFGAQLLGFEGAKRPDFGV